jgi:hypothetical protein
MNSNNSNSNSQQQQQQQTTTTTVRATQTTTIVKIKPKSSEIFVFSNQQTTNNKQQTIMNFEIQALGGKLIGSRSAMKTLDRLTTLLPNAKINFEVLPPPETKKAEFGSMPDFRDPVPETDSDEDDDDIMHDPDIQEMVENGEHTCHMFDAHCQACEDDEEDEEDEDDITLADLKEQLEDNMTLAEIQKELVKVEATKKRLETIRLKKENYKNYENYEEKKETFEFVDEMTYHSRTSDHLPKF